MQPNIILTHTINGFSDFVHRPDSKELVETRRFGNWICFRPQVRGDDNLNKKIRDIMCMCVIIYLLRSDWEPNWRHSAGIH
jgi:hypothetical protein